jgi:hypothetical protein
VVPLWSGQRGRLAALALAVLSTCGSVSFAAAPGAAAAAGKRPSLTLVDQSEWVTPTAGGGAASFELTLKATDPPQDARVTVVVYTRLHTRSGLAMTLRSGPTTAEVGQITAPLSALPPDPHSPGSVELDIAVTTSNVTVPSPAIDLGCSAAADPADTGTCPGVYPVVVTLRGGATTRSFTTFLTYATGDSATPLDFAWVVPVSTPVTVRAHASTLADAVAPLSARESGALAGLVSELHANPQVPVTVVASPETLQELSASGSAGRSAVAELAAMSADQAVTELPAEPYVPIDLGALDAADAVEVGAQMDAGAAALQQLGVKTSAPDVWVVDTGPVGSRLAAGMTGIHASLLIAPATDLTAATNGTDGTWTAPFDLQLARSTRAHAGSSVTAAAADPQLRSELSRSAVDPALAATQFLADLAMVHFEAPYTPTPRGILAVPPKGWTPNSTFDRVLLAGLEGNPDVVPVTTSTYFTTVPNVGARDLARPGTGPGLSASVSRALGTARSTLTEFEGAVAGAPPVLSQLTRLLLDSEDGELGSAAQAAAIGTFRRVLSAQLHLVKFASGGTVTLTARTGWIPITVVSSAHYTVVGRLTLTGHEGFEFPDGSSHRMTLDHPSNPIRIDVRARSSGDLPLTATFTSPDGALTIATGTFTVRSTATSLVGIVLTAVALAVLLVWWARTWWAARRRRRPRGPHPVQR